MEAMDQIYSMAVAPDVALRYDYGQIEDVAEREVLHAAATRIREVMDNALWVVGSQLIQAKAAVSHGVWLDWLRGEWDFSEKTAQNYMNMARAIEAGGEKYTALGLTPLALLGAQDPATVATVGPALLDQHTRGEGSGRGGAVNVADVKAAINRAAGREVYTGAEKPAKAAPVSTPTRAPTRAPIAAPAPVAPVYVDAAPTARAESAPAWPPPSDLAAILVPAHVARALGDAVAGGVLDGFLSDAQTDLLDMAIRDALMTLDYREGLGG